MAIWYCLVYYFVGSGIESLWLRAQGYACDFEVVWDTINLQDEVEDAKAQLYLEQARQLRLANDKEEFG